MRVEEGREEGDRSDRIDVLSLLSYRRGGTWLACSTMWDEVKSMADG
jgi:hypothetical protein